MPSGAAGDWSAAIVSSVIMAPIFSLAITIMYFDLVGDGAPAAPAAPVEPPPPSAPAA